MNVPPHNGELIINVAYTVQEIQALTNLLDIATKASGLVIAADAAILHSKHSAAVQTAQAAINTPDEFTIHKQLRKEKAKVDAAVDEQSKDS